MPFNVGGIILSNTLTKLYNNENIVTSDLVLYLDAGISTSYPGSGTTWTDLTGNGNNFTLYNGVGYSTENGGCLTFDGANDYIASTGNVNLTSYNHVAVEIIHRSNSPSDAMLFEHTANWNTNTGGFGLAVNSDGMGNSLNSNHTNHNTEVARNYFVPSNYFFWKNNLNLFSRISDSTGRLTYVNGELTSFITGPGYPTDTVTTAGGSFANAIFYIGSRGGSSGFLNGRVSSIKIYGFKITASQALQNFNSNRRKFSI